MGLLMKEKQAVTKQLALKYKRAGKKEKGAILDGLIELTKYNRNYAARALRQRVQPKILGKGKAGKVEITLLADERSKRKRRKRPRKYDHQVLLALRRIWSILDGICGKRLGPYLSEIIPVLERCGEIKLSQEVRDKLLQISPATIDRLLAGVRKEYQLKARSQTKPGTLLKHQIPIRTFNQWDDLRPGFVEIDLVSHEGGNASGDFIQTLDVTDVCSGWTEIRAVKNKAQVWVFEALMQIKEQIPFELLGIDSDNGSEFINSHLLRFCDEHEISFTRSRPYQKNDNCYVEQKNYSVVRRAVGYARYDTQAQLETLNKLYDCLRLYINFFQPVMKLVEKTRTGSKVKKTYDTAKTPYQRVLDSSCIPKRTKTKLKKTYEKLNPATLKREIDRLQTQLDKLARSKQASQKVQNKDDLEYILT